MLSGHTHKFMVRIPKELNQALKDLQHQATQCEEPLFYTIDPLINLMHVEHQACLENSLPAVYDEHTRMYEELLDPVGDTSMDFTGVLQNASIVKTAIGEIADRIGNTYKSLIFEYWDDKKQMLIFSKV